MSSLLTRGSELLLDNELVGMATGFVEVRKFCPWNTSEGERGVRVGGGGGGGGEEDDDDDGEGEFGGWQEKDSRTRTAAVSVVNVLHNVLLYRASDTCYTLIFKPIIDSRCHADCKSLAFHSSNGLDSPGSCGNSDAYQNKYVQIDDVAIVDNELVCANICHNTLEQFKFEKVNYHFSFSDEVERRIFVETFNNCISTQEIALRLASGIRDLYYSGVYTNDCSSFPSTDEFDLNLDCQFEFDYRSIDADTDSSLLAMSATTMSTAAISTTSSSGRKDPTSSKVKIDNRCNCKKSRCLTKFCACIRLGKFCVTCSCRNCDNVDPNIVPKENKDAIAGQVLPSLPVALLSKVDLACFYCMQSLQTNTNLLFSIHPYVPKDLNGRDIMMCSTCVFNWKDYRDKVIEENALYLPGERNEDICSLCSGTPESYLTICSHCERSFCDECLSDRCGYKTKCPNLENEDWSCFVCKAFCSEDAAEEAIETSREIIKQKEKTKKVAKEGASKSHEVAIAEVTPCKISLSARTGRPLKPVEKFTVDQSYSRGTFKYQTGQLAASVPFVPTTGGGKRKQTMKALLDVDSALFISTDALQDHDEAMLHTSASSPMVSIVSNAAIDGPQDVILNAKILKMTLGQNENVVKSEIFFFSQYLSFYEKNYSNFVYQQHHTFQKLALTAQKAPSRLNGDDVCFICKDGGDLIECDAHSKIKFPDEMNINCRKAYHPSCLSSLQSIEDWSHERKKWFCPCHFCDICGKKDVYVKCLFCTQSICKKCLQSNESGYDFINSVVIKPVSQYEVMSTEVAIACSGCYEVMKLCDANKSLPSYVKRQIQPSRIAYLKDLLQQTPNTTTSSLSSSDSFSSTTLPRIEHREDDLFEDERLMYSSERHASLAQCYSSSNNNNNNNISSSGGGGSNSGGHSSSSSSSSNSSSSSGSSSSNSNSSCAISSGNINDKENESPGVSSNKKARKNEECLLQTHI